LANSSPGVEWAAASELLSAPRRIKDAAEIKAIKKSQRLNEAIFTEMCVLLSDEGPGCCTESDLAKLLKVLMIKHGVEPSFEPIVAHKKNGSKPHYHPGDEIIGKGPTLVDMGVVLDGYCSDMTRVFCFGRPTEKLSRVYEA